MQIADIDLALAECENVIKQVNAQGTKLETYLVGYLLVLMSSCFQIEIRNIVTNTLSLSAADLRVRNYIEKSLMRYFQSVQIESMEKLLGFFGEERKLKFKKSLKSNPQSRQASALYSNIITNRHATAHSIGPQMTFNDLKNAYSKGHVVLDYFVAALV